MKPEQATELGKRVINTMRPTPGLGEWTEVLEPLELDDALVVFRELRDETDGGLTIARYLGTYRARLNARRARIAERAEYTSPPPRCELCDGTGWVDAPPERAHRPNLCRGEPGTATCRSKLRWSNAANYFSRHGTETQPNPTGKNLRSPELSRRQFLHRAGAGVALFNILPGSFIAWRGSPFSQCEVQRGRHRHRQPGRRRRRRSRRTRPQHRGALRRGREIRGQGVRQVSERETVQGLSGDARQDGEGNRRASLSARRITRTRSSPWKR